MSLETVVEDIREEARARAAEIREEAEGEAEEIIAEAEDEAEEIIEQAEREAERQIERERERSRSSATLEAKQERLGARRDVLESVHDQVASAVADLDRDRRKELTAATIEAGLAEFDDDASIRVYGRESDAELLEELLENHENAQLDGTVDCLGGVVLESDASRVRVNNTFDSVLESVWEDELKNISDRLFEA